MAKKIVIIGSGIAGLSTGIRLLNAGFEVEIFEKNGHAGGRMDFFEEKGFHFDLGPTLILMPQIYGKLFSDVGRNIHDYIDMQSLDPIYTIYDHDNMKISVPSELSELVPTLEKISPHDTQGYFQYINTFYKRYNLAKDHFIQKSFKNSLSILNPINLFWSLKLRTFSSAYQSMKKFFSHPTIQKIFTFQTLYIGISPYNGPSIYNIIPLVESLYGIHYSQGGMYSVTKALEKLFLELGGKIHYNQNVTKIDIHQKKATGIIVQNAEVTNTITADIIVNTADFPYALENLIDPKVQRGRYNIKTIRKRKYSCSAFLIYLGLDTKLDHLDVHTFLYAKDFDKNCQDIFSGIEASDPSIYLYNPSKIDSSVAPENSSSLYILVPIPNLQLRKSDWSEAEVETYKNHILDIVEKKLDINTRDHIVVEKINTPHSLEEDYNAFYGAAFGLAPTLTQSNIFRPQTKALAVENLYFAGASNHPGAGVPIVLTSGEICANEIIKDYS